MKYKIEITNINGEWVNYPILESISNSKELTLDLIDRIKPTLGILFRDSFTKIRIVEVELNELPK